jgi:hypothetical protein
MNTEDTKQSIPREIAFTTTTAAALRRRSNEATSVPADTNVVSHDRAVQQPLHRAHNEVRESSSSLRASWLSFVRRQERRRQQRLASLGYSGDGRPLPAVEIAPSVVQYPVKECTLYLPSLMNEPVLFNPVVTIIAVVGLWSIVTWCAGTYSKKNVRVHLCLWDGVVLFL